MNFNIISYCIYGLITFYIIIWVGRLFHKNGRVFILSFFHENEELTDTTNNLLLTAYYLFNIGYTIIQLSYWEKVESFSLLLSTVANKTGILVFILAALHYNNMFIIYLISRKNKKLTN